MKDKVQELLSIAKGKKPSYFIQYTVEEGKIIILEGRKMFDGSPDLIWGDAMAELRDNEEVIVKFEKDGVNEEKAALWHNKWNAEDDCKLIMSNADSTINKTFCSCDK